MKTVIKRALMSVTDKKGIVDLAKALSARGIEIIASGGTAEVIRKSGTEVSDISDITGFPEIMDGRVKTLHPKIHGGILADRSKAEHMGKAKELGIEPIDLVVVNLYRFKEAASNPDLNESDVVEEIDIGGPTLIRSAAKNYASVAVVVDPKDYEGLVEELDENGGSITNGTKRLLSSKAFHHTAAYDAAISSYFDGLHQEGGAPDEKIEVYTKLRSLRYGENPHLGGSLYLNELAEPTFSEFEQLQGKELSYNNIQDMYAAFLLARDLGENSCAVIKHMNPCGAASCGDPAESFARARKTDPTSAFGSVVSFNGTVDLRTAEQCTSLFLELIISKGFSDEAITALKKKKNLRLIRIPEKVWEEDLPRWVTREVGDLLLLQQVDEGFPEIDDWKVVTSRKPGNGEARALEIAWKIVKHIRSNAIVICDEEGTIGIGAGQMSRVDSCRIAVWKAEHEGLNIKGASAASDAFFPFPDGVEILAEAGVKSIVQPGGSIRDGEVTEAAEKLGISMIMTGRRHFRH